MDTPTVTGLLDTWLEWRRLDEFAVTSLETTQNAVKILKAEFGDISADAIKPRHVEQWYMQRKSDGYASSYSKRIMGVLSAAYSLGIRWELVDANPVMGASGPKSNTEKVNAPTTSAVKRALQQTRSTDPLLHLFIRVAVVTGARRSELLGLRRSEFDADLGLITIRRVALPSSGITVVERTKSSNGARVVSIDPDTVALIEKSLGDHDSQWLFPGKRNTAPLHPSTVTHRLQRLGWKIGEHLHAHGFRHYSATQALAAGVPVVVVAARLGDSPATIQRVYAHAIGGTDAAAAAAMAGLLE